MFESAVSVYFWILFPIGALLAATCLIGTYWRGFQLSIARWNLDDGADSGRGYEVYLLYKASNRLVARADAIAAAFVALVAVGALGGGVYKLSALAVAVALVLAASRLRTRHAAIEAGFERLAGEPLADFARRLRGAVSLA